jgi:hypothetical protein
MAKMVMGKWEMYCLGAAKFVPETAGQAGENGGLKKKGGKKFALTICGFMACLEDVAKEAGDFGHLRVEHPA